MKTQSFLSIGSVVRRTTGNLKTGGGSWVYREGLDVVKHDTKPATPSSQPQSLFAFVVSFLKTHYAGIRFRLVDINCLVYMGVIGIALPFFHHHVPSWPLQFGIHVFLVVTALEIIRLGGKFPDRKAFSILRSFYPVCCYVYGWTELGHMVRMFSGSYWAVDMLVGLDKTLFGVHPTVWMQRHYRPWLDELMNVFYSGYCFYMPVVLIPLFLRKKREEMFAALSIVTFTYFTNFLLFYVFPAVGPQMITWIDGLGHVNYTGYLAASFTKFIQANGDTAAGAFPSSHVSGAVAWALAAWRYNRRVGRFLVPMVPGVALGTVYLGYHHGVDPIAGLILGFTCYGIALSILKKRKEDPGENSYSWQRSSRTIE